MPEEYVNIKDAALIVGVTTAAIYMAIKKGELGYAAELPCNALRKADVEAFRDRGGRKTGRPRKATSAAPAAPSSEPDAGYIESEENNG